MAWQDYYMLNLDIYRFFPRWKNSSTLRLAFRDLSNGSEMMVDGFHHRCDVGYQMQSGRQTQRWCESPYEAWLVVNGCHECYFPICWESSSQLTNSIIFQDGVAKNQQPEAMDGKEGQSHRYTTLFGTPNKKLDPSFQNVDECYVDDIFDSNQ